MARLREVFLETSGLNLEQLSMWGEELCNQQRAGNWAIGDVARYARDVLRLGENLSQAFPPWASPGLIQRCLAVADAYPKESDRNHLATWTVHAVHANKPNRIELVAASVDAGRTSDEERQISKGSDTNKPRWLLAVDVNYFLHRFWFSGAGVESAVGVATWVQRTVDRLKEKGLTDLACCMDSKWNHRKEFTKDWEDKYKDRPTKEPELAQQLNLVQDLLIGQGFACVSLDGMEADDVMASYAKQFPGRVTLLTQDKDCRQCLSEKCNMLLDVEWKEDEHSGDMLPEYKWLSAAKHTEATGIPPERWVEYQCLRGDPTDGIRGCEGIGGKGAADLVQWFETADGAIQAAKESDPRIKESKRLALIEFEHKLPVTRQLVTLRTDLELPTTTKI